MEGEEAVEIMAGDRFLEHVDRRETEEQAPFYLEKGYFSLNSILVDT